MGLTENEIRPRQFEDGKALALRHDLEWLTCRKDLFVSVACPACGSKKSSNEFEKYGFKFELCAECQTAYMNPRAPAAMLAEFYRNSALYEFWNKHIFPASRKVRQEKIFAPRARRILCLVEELGIDKDVVVDVGAAGGMFCEEVMRLNAFRRVVAVEPGRALADTCRSFGIETIEAPIENVQCLAGKVDVVTSFETVEHLFSPQSFMQTCATLLKPGGLLVMTCPNYEGFDIQALGPKSDSLDAEHINLFNPSSLEGLARRCGLAVVECTTPGQLDAELVRAKALDGTLDLAAQPFLRTVLLSKWEALGQKFQEFLSANRLSSHLWLVARNPL